jgi:uncharacterized protein (TIGR02996 family)
MNEDAAFISAILANPVEETTRLAYADWLDEHSDPRGAYLRAEAKWGHKRSAKAEAQARVFAQSLDPVWVARVSRPPLGVCCDRVKLIRYPGAKAVTGDDLDTLEKRFEIKLPPDYRAFLLNYNGGTPHPCSLRIRGREYGRGQADLVVDLHGIHSHVDAPPLGDNPVMDWDVDTVRCLQFLEWIRNPSQLQGGPSTRGWLLAK